MLTSVQGLMGNRQIGVVDTDTNKLVVPLSYSAITFQKYGIIAHYPGGLSDVYHFDGTLVLSKALNPLLLDDNFIIASNNNGKCYIFKSKNGSTKLFNKSGFDSISFFFGSNSDPKMYNSAVNFTPFFTSADYLNNGACFDRYICVTLNGYWGVIHRDTGKVAVNFNAKEIIHRKNTQLIITCNDDHVIML